VAINEVWTDMRPLILRKSMEEAAQKENAREVERPSPWVLAPGAAAPVRLRMFCVPYAGGGASIYRTSQSTSSRSSRVKAQSAPGSGGKRQEGTDLRRRERA
jgi:hypothetical protein